MVYRSDEVLWNSAIGAVTRHIARLAREKFAELQAIEPSSTAIREPYRREWETLVGLLRSIPLLAVIEHDPVRDAAPDMLAALKTVQEYFASPDGGNPEYTESVVNAAVTKAETV